MLKVILSKYVDQQVELGVYNSKSRKVRGKRLAGGISWQWLAYQKECSLF